MQPLKTLRQEMDRLFEDFDRGFWRSPFRSGWSLEPFVRSELKWPAAPAVDIVETENEFKVTAELPGMDEKNVEVKLANGSLTIRGEKQEEKEEKKTGHYLRERSYGSFERCFQVPDGVDKDKIDASLKQGVLTVVMPKTAEAKKSEKKIEVKPA
jgi:HSP20 family protein